MLPRRFIVWIDGIIGYGWCLAGGKGCSGCSRTCIKCQVKGEFSIIPTLPLSLACLIDANNTIFTVLLKQTVGGMAWMGERGLIYIEVWVGGQGSAFSLIFYSIFVVHFFSVITLVPLNKRTRPYGCSAASLFLHCFLGLWSL